MDELAQRMATMREGVAPPWSDERGERVFLGVGRRARQQRARRRVVSAAIVAAVGVISFPYARAALVPSTTPAQIAGAAPTQRDSASRASVSSAAEPPLVRAIRGKRLTTGERAVLPDGSHTQVFASGGELYLDGDRPDDIQLRLETGAARFEVVPNLKRRFAVAAGAVQVLVVGTAFDVERSGDRVRVAVSHGKVRVRSTAGEAFVQAGESRWFDQAGAPAAEAAVAANRSRAATPAGAKARALHASRSAQEESAVPSAREELPRLDWRTLNDSGDYVRAYELLVQGAHVDDDAEALMDAADAARLSNHPEAAAKYLGRVLANHRASAATPLAAFTLGRVLLERLARPSEAAEAFAVARELAPQGSLAQDALAREVEAWSKAGRSEEAYRRAHQFLQLYPQSRRAPAVKQYGGLAH